ncbi:hypothetical protein [Cupriavidus sp. IK-TO18]|uniref:hypothetical protein n=1 Tax=Cupriavidus sp. IK-TO18 TaxID=2782182 RepID=UPI001897E311|nr:hypothetical protein [Cupriavidus sp. IK-TO18]MBF6992218.1 hypothetical protein [Cupriavidus sp. IK-TO18]
MVDSGPPAVDTLWLVHRAEWPLSPRAARVLEHLRAGSRALHGRADKASRGIR